MKKILILLLFLCAGFVQAQDIFKMKLYSTDNLMEVREEIGLTDAQVAKVKKLHSENAGSFSTLKWDLDEATTKLRKMLEQPKIDQTAVSKQMDEVLRLENQMKKTQLNTMVSIKNELTPEQITKLEERKVLTVGKASAISGSSVQVISGSGVATVNGLTTTTTSPKIAVSVAGSGNQPLYYIETKSGLKKVDSLEGFEANNIESINVLKGDEATKKYGVAGENGVIVIKLKNMPE